MGVTAVYNGVTLSRIRWSLNVSAIRGQNSNIEGYNADLKVHGVNVNSSAATMASSLSTIDTALRKNGEDLKIWDGSNTIFDLTAAECKGGGPNVEYSIPRDKFKIGWNFPVDLHVWGRIDPVKPDSSESNTDYDEYTISYDHDEQDRVVRRKSGRVKASSGTTVLSLKDGLDPGTDSDTYLSSETNFDGYERIGESWEEDSDHETANYSFVDRAYYVEPETDFERVDLTIEREWDGEQIVVSMSGSVAGKASDDIETVRSNLDTFIESKVPSQQGRRGGNQTAKIIKKRYREDEYNNQISFSVQALSGDGDDILSQSETYRRRVEHKKVIMAYIGSGGESATVGSAHIYETIEGDIQTLKAAPTVPAPQIRSGMELMDEEYDEVKPQKRVDGKLIYRYRYRYEYEGLKGGMGTGGGGGSGGGGTDRITDGVVINLGGGRGAVTLGL